MTDSHGRVTTSNHRGLLAGIVLGTAFLTLNLFAFICKYAVNVPFWDQWIFLSPVWTNQPWYVLFDWQHGPHRQGPLFCLTAIVLDFNRSDHRIEALWIGFWLVIAAFLALALVRRMTRRWHSADILLAVWCLSLTQFETITFTPNLSHSIGPLTLLLATAHFLWTKHLWLRWLGAAVFGCFLTFTGFGIFAGVILVGLAAATAGRNLYWSGDTTELWAALTALGLLLGGFALFSQGYVFNPASEGFSFPHHPLRDYVPFLARMMALPFGFTAPTGLAAVVGYASLILTVAVLLDRGRRLLCANGPDGRDAIIVLLLGTALLFATNATVGRIHLGPNQAIVPRYVSLLLPLPIAAYLLARSTALCALRRCAIVGLAALAFMPYGSVFSRSGAWLGTLGLPRDWEISARINRNQKLAWYFAYERTHDPLQANALARTRVYSTDQLAPMVKLLETQKLSFAAGNDASLVLPLIGPFDPVYVGFHDEDGGAHWMPAEGEVLLFPKAPGWLNVEIKDRFSGLDKLSPLEFTFQGQRGSILVPELPDGISLPVNEPGPLSLRLRSPAGTRRPSDVHDSIDIRDLSFRIGRVSVDAGPRFAHTIRTEIDYGLGFFPWEHGPDGSMWCWMGSEGVIRLRNTHRDMQLSIKGRVPQEVTQPTIGVEFNGEALDTIAGARGELQRKYDIPAAKQTTDEWSRVRITTDQTFVPHEKNPASPDLRRLGFAVYELSWEPK